MFGKKKVLVRTYKHRDPAKAARRFEDDANRLAKQGYIVAQTSTQDLKSGHLLLGGIGLLAPTVITVTYRLE